MTLATLAVTIVTTPLNAQMCTGTAPPCVLTAGYAGPATDANFNARQAMNQYETTLTPTTAANLGTTGDFFEVDDQAFPVLPNGAASNPIMAQPLYLAGMNLGSNSNWKCQPCNVLVAVTLNSTIFAWIADGQQNSHQSAPGTMLWSRQGTNIHSLGTNALYYDDCQQTGSMPGGVIQQETLQFDGILSTPVIDASGSTPVMYVTSLCTTSQTNGSNTSFFTRST